MPRARCAVLLALLAAGCAHDRGQYAFAPPLVPPVYPQPPGYATPQPAPGPVPAPVAAAPVAVSPHPGSVAAAGADPCAGVVAADGGLIEAPCPPAGEIVSDGVVVTGGAGPWVVVDDGSGAVVDPGFPRDGSLPCDGSLSSDGVVVVP